MHAKEDEVSRYIDFWGEWIDDNGNFFGKAKDLAVALAEKLYPGVSIDASHADLTAADNIIVLLPVSGKATDPIVELMMQVYPDARIDVCVGADNTIVLLP